MGRVEDWVGEGGGRWGSGSRGGAGVAKQRRDGRLKGFGK